ncbi:tetratricopeptide repeat protein [Congregibacter variabilis]|uniref:Tetratricopeptide repeat protein n=1 Tax=Congregibacter variabilis TaxID=3081200 RepID=A0ABZ0I2B1_9GAMM|nr:tetratricopeptide repeat protein [Congregibacter sp. IMCC43200]
MAAQMTASQALERAALLAKAGNVDEAKRLYAQVLSAEPGNKKAKKGLKALTGSSKATLSPADFDRVARLVNAGKLDAARADINKLCRLHPEQPALHNLRGVVLSRLEESEHAIDAYKSALSLEPGFSEALNNLATAFTDLKRYKEALGCYQELVNRGQADAEVYANLARALKGAGQADNALEALRRALQLNPLYTDAFNDLGNVLNDMGKHDDAIKAYESALSLEPTHRKALLNLSRSLSGMSRHNEALMGYQEILDLDPMNEAALGGASNTLQALGREQEALEYLQKILKLRPDDKTAKHLVAAISGQNVSRGDAAYARAVFEGYAANFEKHLTESLEYSIPGKIPSLLEKLDGENAWYSQALDLGCGTGLVGAQIRSYCEHLTGVDVAPAMLAKAEEKAVYDALTTNDVSAMLSSDESRYDLIVCADVLIYIGALDEVFKRVAQRSNPGVRFVLSTELLEGQDLKLQKSGRFAHSSDYVQRCAKDAGLTLLHKEQIPLRKERGEWLPGELFVFTR